MLLLALAAWAAPSAGAAGSIYWSTTGGAIQVGNLDGSGSPTTLFSGENGPLGVAIDPAASKIYWGNFDAIRVGNLDGSGSAANVFGGQANPSGVAINPAANKIYWGDTINAVRVGNLDGSGAPTNLFTEPDLGGGIEGQPLGVAVDPAANRIYWTDFSPYLVRAGNLDGSGSATTLFPNAGSNPRGVAIDPAGGKIYWANSDGDIDVGNLDGSGSPATLFGGEGGRRKAWLSTTPPTRSTGAMEPTSGSETWTAQAPPRPCSRAWARNGPRC